MINRWYQNTMTKQKAKLINIIDVEPYGFSVYKLEYALQYENGEIIKVGETAFRAVWEIL